MVKSKTGNDKTMRIKMPKINLDRQKMLQHQTSKCVSIIIKPLRIFQFFAVLLLFVFTIYMIVMDPMPMSALVCILLIVLSGVYVFVLAVELISHFAGGALHIIPMTVFSLLGLLFFGVAGVLLISAYTQLVVQIIAVALCLLTALFFLIDITMVLAFWKRRCSVCKQCCNGAAKILLHKDEEPSTPEREMMKHDVTTSLSDVRVPRKLECVALPDHCYRKVEYPRRREYVDCPTCVPSLCNLDIAQTQTEPKRMSIVESQTPSAVTKETPMQTLSKCEFCHQQILPLALPVVEGAVVPSTHCFQHPSQWSYPVIVQFVRGGVSAASPGQPCCPRCKCMPSTVQTQQQQQQQQQLTQEHMRSLTQTVPNPSKTLTSETTQQVASTGNGNNDNVTRLTTTQTIPTYTVASFYGPEKRIKTVPDFAYKRKVDATKIKEDTKPSKDIDRKFVEEAVVKLANTKRPDTVEDMINIKKRRNKDSIEESEEEKIIGEDIKIERSKGGGEYCARIYQEFMRAREQGSITNLEESSTHTQMIGTLITPTNSRTKPRALLHLKSNKVDPIKDANVSDEDCIPEKIISRMTLEKAAQKNEHSARTGSPNLTIEHQMNDACSLCKRQKSLTPTSDNSRCYIVFKDRKGRYFCEFCAPQDSKKITSRLEGTDLRKLQCANCQLHLRGRGVRTNVKLKSDRSCPKCGRSQRHAISPSST